MPVAISKASVPILILVSGLRETTNSLELAYLEINMITVDDFFLDNGCGEILSTRITAAILLILAQNIDQDTANTTQWLQQKIFLNKSLELRNNQLLSVALY